MTSVKNTPIQHLVLGGARSGKSGFSERLVEKITQTKGTQKVYIATATADDNEMAERIKRHQAQRDDQWHIIEETTDLATQLSPADIVMVSNEVGSGIIPMGELSRRFVDESGWLHQNLAQQCSHVSLIVAGLESVLKKTH